MPYHRLCGRSVHTVRSIRKYLHTMKAALLATVVLLAAQAQADLVEQAPAAEPMAPAPAPAESPAWDVPCPAPGAVYTSLEECDQAILAGVDMAKAQGVGTAELRALGITPDSNSTRSTSISSSVSINGESLSVKYRRVIYKNMSPPLYCCGLKVETSTAGNTAVPDGMQTTSAASPAWGLQSFAAAAALAAGAAVLVM
ncbi:hypothetical protein COHA_005285 [Chlorella ohadii]|uniref:Uncharacterized protein n=1 Tax=Chlorella ohadii TaxID=2649997 RepID=A0AAD5H6F9_9CHLO|nr:hypothetical protein COHA_005285 [Chlorella ohadii]